jgi:hypothetical protein
MNMITGLLFTLAQKAPVAANDHKGEGRHFPPVAKSKKVKAPYNVVRTTQTLAAVLTLAGLALLSFSTSNWSFDPAGGLHIQTAVLSFTLPVGVFS